MKSNWEVRKLGEVCEFVRGPFGGSLKKNIFKSEGYAVYEQQHAIYDQFDDIRYFIDEHKFNEMKRFELKSGDLIMSCSGTMGKIAIVPKDIRKGIINQALLKLTPNAKLNIYFLRMWMESQDFQDQLSKFTKGAAIKNVASVAVLKNILIPLPALSEQKRIVEILDKAFENISQAKNIAEKNLDNADEIFESYLQSIFKNKGDGWEEKNIGEICDLMTGGTPSRAKREYFEEGKIRWLVSGDVNMGEIYECNGRITELGMSNSSAKYLPVNSIVMALNGQGKTRGTVAMLHIKATCNQSLVSIYPKDIKKILPEYIYHNLNNRYKEIRKITSDSDNDRRGLNMPLIRNIRLTYPKTIAEQRQFIEKFSTLSQKTKLLETIYEKKLTDLEELKKSILQKAFKGELTGVST